MNQKTSLSDGGRAIYKSRAGWFAVTYPSNWSIEEEDECVTIIDPKTGVGALQVSAYRPPVVQDPREVLIEYLSDHQVRFEREAVAYRNDGERAVAAYAYTDGPWYKKVWFVSEAPYLLLATYTCKVEDHHNEIDIAETMVDSITLFDVNDHTRDGERQ